MLFNLMSLVYDIGGTHFKYYYINNGFMYYYCKTNTQNQIIEQINESLKTVNYNYNKIKIAIAGIVEDNIIQYCNNLWLNDGTKLPLEYNDIKIEYINDGDSYILGETIFNKIQIKNKNILGLYFGTGVSCGLLIDGKIVKNSKIYKILESFMKDNKINDSNLNLVIKFLGDKISNLVELLNLDFIILNGYINKYKDKILEVLNYNNYYNPKIIFSTCKIPVVYGLVNDLNKNVHIINN